MKLTKLKLHQLIKEELEALIEDDDTDDYDADNPPPEEMIADVLQDGLKKLIPGYDRDQYIEEEVHDQMMEFARKLYDLIGRPNIEVDPQRYHRDPEDDEDLEQRSREHKEESWMQEGKPDQGQKKATKEWGKKNRKGESTRFRRSSKKEMGEKTKEVRGEEK